MIIKYHAIDGTVNTMTVNAPGPVRFRGQWCVFESGEKQCRVHVYDVVAIYDCNE